MSTQPEAATDWRRAAQRLMNRATFCPSCGRVPEYEGSSFGFVVSCSNCFDGAPDSGPQITGTGETLALAVEHWNQAVEENSPLTCACGHSSDVHLGNGCSSCACAGWEPKVA